MKTYLYLLASDGVGGVEKRFSYLFKYLAQKDHLSEKVIFFVNWRLYQIIEGYRTNITNPNVQIIVYGKYNRITLKYRYLRYLSRVVEYIEVLFKLVPLSKREYISVAVYISERTLRFRRFIKSKHNLKLVVASTINEFANPRIFRQLLNEGFYFDCLSQDISKKVIEAKIVDKDRVFTSPNSFIDYTNTEFDIEKKFDVVSFVGRFWAHKGIPLLIDVIKYVLSKSDQIKFQVMGDGPLQGELDKLVSEGKYANQVKVFFTPDTKEYLKPSFIFLSLQRVENYPSQALLEAMACGNAIIATDVGLTHLLVDEEVGKRVPRDPAIIGDMIIEMLSDKEKLRQLCINARKRVINTHTAERYYSYLTNIFND